MLTISLINNSICVIGLTVSALGLLLTAASRFLERWTKNFFLAFFVILIAYTASELVMLIAMDVPDPSAMPLAKAFMFSQSLLASFLMPLLTLFLLKCSGDDWRRSSLFYIAAALWLVYVPLLVSTEFSPAVYSFSGNNVYRRGPLYPLLLTPLVLNLAVNLAVNLAGIYRRRARLTDRQHLAFFIYNTVPLVAMLIQMRFGGEIVLYVLGTDLASLALFLFILQEQTSLYVAQSEENLRQQADILLLQMRPHFIYNTMTNIYYLCDTDPKKAQELVGSFTTYLRRSFSAVAKEELIPFEEELEHTRAYLAVAQARYEELLNVEFDTPHTGFLLPPLTLQPIVENAVKHGVDPELDPLTVSIRTEAGRHGSVITVEDDGPGFSPAEDSQVHVGLENVRRRLDMMCGGTLRIAAREGGGTVVTMFLPESKTHGHAAKTPEA